MNEREDSLQKDASQGEPDQPTGHYSRPLTHGRPGLAKCRRVVGGRAEGVHRVLARVGSVALDLRHRVADHISRHIAKSELVDQLFGIRLDRTYGVLRSDPKREDVRRVKVSHWARRRSSHSPPLAEAVEYFLSGPRVN